MMDSAGQTNENPYEPPAAIPDVSEAASTTTWISRTLPWLLTVFGVATTAAIVGGLVEYLIYVDDPRTGTSAGPPLIVPVLGGGLLCGTAWGLVTMIAQGRAKALLIALAISILVAAIWVAVGGTYADVLAAATVVGWPLGGIVGAMISRVAAGSENEPVGPQR